MKSFNLSAAWNRSEKRERFQVSEPTHASRTSTMEQDQLDRVLAGDIQAFRYFVERYQAMGYSIAMGVVQNKMEAEDVVQEAFIKAFKGLRKFKRQSKFSSWFYRIVTNEALNRRRSKRATSIHEDISDLDERLHTNLDDTMRNLEREERRAMILRILSILKPKEALVLRLHYLEEQSIAEIAEMTAFSLANVKVLLHRGRQHFYARFQDLYQKEEIL